MAYAKTFIRLFGRQHFLSSLSPRTTKCFYVCYGYEQIRQCIEPAGAKPSLKATSLDVGHQVHQTMAAEFSDANGPLWLR
ncbi:hypothetical protein D3C72_1959700 [compost metagenome]